jgi:hypothetical protein
VKQDVIGISSTDDKYNIQLLTTDLLSCHCVESSIHVRYLWSNVKGLQ